MSELIVYRICLHRYEGIPKAKEHCAPYTQSLRGVKIKQEFVDREERGGRITCSEDRVKALDREAGADQH